VSDEWIDAVAVFAEAAHAERFQRLVERSVSGLDATCLLEEHLGVELATEEDVALFRLALLDETTADDIRRASDLLYLVSPRLSGDARRCIDQGLVQGSAAPLTAARLELRDEVVLRSLEEALEDERRAFVGQPPALYPA
jgi:hypothetical protein